MDKEKVYIEIEIVDSTDPSVQCIHALRQVMDYFQTKNNFNNLSSTGKDIRSTYAWFCERYKINNTFDIKLKESL